MRIGLGVLGWPPETFWAATLGEFNAAVEGWNMAHGQGYEDSMSRDELAELMRAYPDK